MSKFFLTSYSSSYLLYDLKLMHYYRLSANVFGGLNGLPLNAAAAMEGMNGLNMFSRGLESMFGDKVRSTQRVQYISWQYVQLNNYSL